MTSEKSFLSLEALTPERLFAWTRPLLYAGLAFGLLLIVLGAWLSTLLLAVLAAAFLAALVFGAVARNEIFLLCAVLAGFVVSANYEAGFQVQEVFYGLLYFGYLTYWFLSRFFFYRDPVLKTPIDWALFLFLVYVTLSLGLTPLLGGDMKIAVSEWVAISMLAFYFPIKELCIRRPDLLPQKPILLSLGFVTLFIALRNFWFYQTHINNAEFLWQIATGRVVTNEHVLLMGGLVALTILLYSRKRLHATAIAGIFTLLSAAIVIGQSRALWVSYMLGIAVIFLCVDRQKKFRIVSIGVLGGVMFLAVGVLVFDNFFSLIIAGLANRLLSLQTATVNDLSLINRFFAARTALEHIGMNPIVGYGFGVPFKYYSLVYEWTHETSFIHSGPVGIWYRHGLIGLGLLVTFYIGTIARAARMLRMPAIARIDRIVAIFVMACLIAESLVGNTENPFATGDKTLFIGALAGLAAASAHRAAHPVTRPEIHAV